MITKNLAFEIAPDRSQSPPAKLLSTDQRQTRHLPLDFSEQLKTGWDLVRMGEIPPDIHIAAVAIVTARPKRTGATAHPAETKRRANVKFRLTGFLMSLK